MLYHVLTNHGLLDCALQCVGVSVGMYSRHNMRHTDHIEICTHAAHCRFTTGAFVSSIRNSLAILLLEKERERKKKPLKRSDLETLLNLAVKHQLFQFDGNLYEQVDEVAMGFPLGPLLANTFMCSLEERLVKQKQMPTFYRRFVDDTITKQSRVKPANEFLSTLNNYHPSLQFTMEIEVNGKLPFLGAELIRKDDRFETKVFIKPTNTGLLLHFDSNVDMSYKKALVPSPC